MKKCTFKGSTGRYVYTLIINLLYIYKHSHSSYSLSPSICHLLFTLRILYSSHSLITVYKVNARKLHSK